MSSPSIMLKNQLLPNDDCGIMIIDFLNFLLGWFIHMQVDCPANDNNFCHPNEDQKSKNEISNNVLHITDILSVSPFNTHIISYSVI